MTPDAAAALSLIYDAALNPGHWRRALDTVASLSNAKAAALLIRRPDPFARDLQMLNSTFLSFSRSRAGMYYALRYSRLQNLDWDILGACAVHEPTPDTAAGTSRESLDRRADYAYLRGTIGIGPRLGVRLNRDKIWFDGLSLAGDAHVPPQTNKTLIALLPHLTKAAEMGRAIHKLRRKASSATAALDRVQVGLVALLPNAEVIWSNAAAKRILDESDGLSLGHDKFLRCDNSQRTKELSSHMADVAATTIGNGHTAEHLMSVPRRSGRADLLLEVAPLRASHTDFAEDGALLTIIDPQAVPKLPLKRFARLHDLSQAESSVCELIFQGLSIDAIANERNRSPITIKNQIAAILHKTGAPSRVDLIRLALRVMPPVT
ncbi:MAG: helix-turn-helix transcriptional regulator [Paracoccaceae bacterium]